MPDHDRPLTPDGKKAAAEMGVKMRSLGLTPDVIVVSPALRTQQTLDALEPWDDRPNVEILPVLYMASYMQIRETLRELPETVRSVLVIGHNPGIHELAQLFASDAAMRGAKPEFARLADDYPVASLCEFLVTVPWHKIGPAGTALQRFIQPSDLAGL